MINNVVLVGRMTRDAELRYTPSNVAVATFTLAVNRTFKSQNGEREADFINVVMWRQQAENLANWAKKGSLVGITGRIQTRSYDNQQGQRVYVTEVVAENFQMLESRSAREGQTGELMLHQMRVMQYLQIQYQTFHVMRIHLEQPILWIFQMMIYHSNGQLIL